MKTDNPFKALGKRLRAEANDCWQKMQDDKLHPTVRLMYGNHAVCLRRVSRRLTRVITKLEKEVEQSRRVGH